MQPFMLVRAASVTDAMRGEIAEAAFLAGGTTLLDLMKLNVLQPQAVTDIGGLRDECGGIEADADGLRFGALVRMAELADHAAVRRDYRMIADSLWQAASPQLRNMASVAGNVLQRTRCAYFRDTSWQNCNKRRPGSGCAALDGVNRRHAVLGVSESCIAAYPGDFANALVALDAEVDLRRRDGSTRRIAVETLHCLPADHPERETVLEPGELITGFRVKASPCARRSVYVKIRDRASYDFALASAAVGLDLAADGTVREARVALGGVAAKPWRSRAAEAALAGKQPDEAAARDAAKVAFQEAVTHGQNGFKVELGRRTLMRAIRDAALLEA